MNEHISITLNIDPTDFPQSRTHLILKHNGENWVLVGKYGLYDEGSVNTIVSGDIVNKAINTLRNHQMPVLPLSLLTGCDGTTTTLTFETDKDSHSFSWWSEDGYEILDEFIDILLEWGDVNFNSQMY